MSSVNETRKRICGKIGRGTSREKVLSDLLDLCIGLACFIACGKLDWCEVFAVGIVVVGVGCLRKVNGKGVGISCVGDVVEVVVVGVDGVGIEVDAVVIVDSVVVEVAIVGVDGVRV